MQNADDITRLLEEFTAGRREAINEVIPLVYEELRPDRALTHVG
jgi:hypothetical protein